MDIKRDLITFIQLTGISRYRLAKMAGVDAGNLSKALAPGSERGFHSDTLAKLWPILYGPDSPLGGADNRKEQAHV